MFLKLNDGKLLLRNHQSFCWIFLAWHSTSRNFYDVLEISQKATHAEIKAAYFRKTKKFHPDVSSSPDAASQFREVSEAYETLRHPDKRRLYDRRFSPSENPHDSPPSNQRHHYRTAQYSDEEIWRRMRQNSHGPYKARPDAPHQGAWKHYNFDEHYRGHYGESEKRRTNEQVRREAIRNMIREENKNYVPPTQQILRLLPFVFFNTVFYMALLDKGSKQQYTAEELRGLRDFFLQYNRIAETCFRVCASDFNQRALTAQEEDCVDRCCGKYISTTRRLMTVFWETQTERLAKAAEAQQQQQAAQETPQVNQ